MKQSYLPIFDKVSNQIILQLTGKVSVAVWDRIRLNDLDTKLFSLYRISGPIYLLLEKQFLQEGLTNETTSSSNI